ncbi:hypothetical protein SOCEGT47_052630 [Sorangium cellulosum]|uniref:Uncharacterized protein n=1 Tax=Sorangium cellulosum TaxID=56 RepID=A0A4P2Q5L5_SORCE|nr:hypothetical protein [Sorangium cellulosum]AUX24724.1 hypothetical protein SOCEGT47_052630 [Sorangium cellulosum]
MLGPSPRTGPLLLGALLAALPGCEGADVFIPLPAQSGPAGVLDGAVTYSGPRPCTKDGRVVGAAIVLGFDARRLPPPEGLGASAASLDVIPGDELFRGLGPALRHAPDGALLCPEPDEAHVTVSGAFRLSPLPAGTYQVRGFYDHDGDFDPLFGIANQPTQGDVGGGAIENVGEVLAGAPPRYREIALGTPSAGGALEIPETGARVSGIAVTFGLPFPLERPIFHVAELITPSGVTPRPDEVVVASDYWLDTFSPTDPEGTEASLVRLRLAAGLPASEIAAAAKPPLSLPVGGATASTLTYARQDVNGDGALDAADHVPDAALLPALFPMAVFAKLEGDAGLVSQAAPTVLLQGLTIYEDLPTTAGQLGSETLNDPKESALIGLRPAALCLPPERPDEGVLVLSRERDRNDNEILPERDVPEVEAALSAQLGRTITIAYGCLPEGRYALSLVYGTGQAWTVPNEAGICAPSEPRTSAGACGQRPRLASQDVVVRIGPPDDPVYCAQNPTPEPCLPPP